MTHDAAGFFTGCLFVATTGLWVFTGLLWRSTLRAVAGEEEAIKAALSQVKESARAAKAMESLAVEMGKNAVATQVAAEAARDQVVLTRPPPQRCPLPASQRFRAASASGRRRETTPINPPVAALPSDISRSAQTPRRTTFDGSIRRAKSRSNVARNSHEALCISSRITPSAKSPPASSKRSPVRAATSSISNSRPPTSCSNTGTISCLLYW